MSEASFLLIESVEASLERLTCFQLIAARIQKVIDNYVRATIQVLYGVGPSDGFQTNE